MKKFVFCTIVFGLPFLVHGAAKRLSAWHLSDLTHDPTTTGYYLDPASERESTVAQYNEFVLLSEGKLSKERQDRLRTECQPDPVLDEAPLCPLVRQYLYKKEGRKKREKRASLKKTSLVKSALEQKDFEAFYLARSYETSWLVDYLKKKNKIDTFVDLVTSDKECPPASFLLYAGLRLEVDFPDDKREEQVRRLYQTASKCGNTLATVQAGFRLALFEIADGDFKEAEEILSSIPDSPYSPDYQIRIAYWRHYCAVKNEDHRLVERMKNWLIDEYPLSLHAILVHDMDEIRKKIKFDQIVDPPIRFRSETAPGLNPIVRMVEHLLKEDKPKLAELVMNGHDDRAYLSEVSFQFYWMHLLRQTNDQPEVFQFLAGIFRTHPELMAKDTLRIMYPVHYYDEISLYKKDLDPHLILALMRQESAFNIRAKSITGARGLMQIQPTTARYLGERSIRNLYKPEVNIKLGTKYLSRMIKRFSDQTELAVAAYNAGPSKVRYWQRRFQPENNLLFLELMPIRETRQYVATVARNFFWYRALYSQSEKSGERSYRELNSLLFSEK